MCPATTLPAIHPASRSVPHYDGINTHQASPAISLAELESGRLKRDLGRAIAAEKPR